MLLTGALVAAGMLRAGCDGALILRAGAAVLTGVGLLAGVYDLTGAGLLAGV